MHKRAFERYTDRSVDLLAEWRVESVKAENLSSIGVSAKLDSFQNKMFRLQDTRMNILYQKKGTVSEWQELHETNKKMLAEVGELISQIATELKITKSDIN